MMTSRFKQVVCPLICCSIGLIIVVAVSVLIGLGTVNSLIKQMVDNQLVISLDSPIFSQWTNPAPPIYMQYWFFNVTNPNEIINGEKPILKEIGPLTYRLYQPRYDIAFYVNDTVEYKFNHTVVLDKSLSSLLPNQNITQLNMPLVTISSMLSSLPKPLQEVITVFLKSFKDSDLFVTHTAEEFLYGYNDPIFKFLNKLLPSVIPPQFGLFYQFNNSNDGTYLVKTGRQSVENVNILEKWNYQSSLSWWATDQCNMINGTDGVYMKADLKKSDILYIYNSDICRSIYVVYESETKVRGIDTFRFSVPPQVFESPTKNANNKGFCFDYPNCLKDGVLDISPCKQGAPVIMSCPHFYMADPSYQNAVIGMQPRKEIHETYLDIEPVC